MSSTSCAPKGSFLFAELANGDEVHLSLCSEEIPAFNVRIPIRQLAGLIENLVSIHARYHEQDGAQHSLVSSLPVKCSGGPEDGKTIMLHISKCDGNEFVLRGGSRHGEPIPDRVCVYRDGVVHFLRWAPIETQPISDLGIEDSRGVFRLR